VSSRHRWSVFCNAPVKLGKSIPFYADDNDARCCFSKQFLFVRRISSYDHHACNIMQRGLCMRTRLDIAFARWVLGKIGSTSCLSPQDALSTAEFVVAWDPHGIR
jgi:hypothetical protein